MNENNRPCDAFREHLALQAAGDLPDAESTELFRHLADCSACRQYQQALQKDHKALVSYTRSLQGRVDALTDSVIDRIAADESDTVATPGRYPLWRWMMKTRSGRFFAGGGMAAALLFVFLVIQDTAGPYQAWATVFENVRNATSCRYRARNLASDDSEAVKIFSDIGFLQETHEDGELVETFAVDHVDGTLTHVIWPLKLAVRSTVGDKLIERYLEKDPALMFERFADLEVEDLGRRRMEGRQVVGIGASGRDFVPELMDSADMEMWADPESDLPVRLDVTGRSDDGEMTRRVRFDHFEWNVAVATEDFHPEIPGRFDTVDGGNLEMDEEHTIEALRRIADVLGHYPEALAYLQLSKQMWKELGMDVLTPEVLPELHRSLGACEFYGMLVREERRPLYLGDRIRPGDSEHVLLRWKIDDDKYRVIFGDLRASDVDSEDLLDLESH